MSDKYIISDLIGYLNTIWVLSKVNTEEDHLKLEEIKDKLLELSRMKRDLKDLNFNIKQIEDVMGVTKNILLDIKTITNKYI